MDPIEEMRSIFPLLEALGDISADAEILTPSKVALSVFFLMAGTAMVAVGAIFIAKLLPPAALIAGAMLIIMGVGLLLSAGVHGVMCLSNKLGQEGKLCS